MSCKATRLEVAIGLINSGIISPEHAERLMNMKQVEIKDPAMGSGGFVVEALDHIFPIESADVEDARLTDRCEQLERENRKLQHALDISRGANEKLAQQRNHLLRQNAELSDKERGLTPIGHFRASDVERMMSKQVAELADAREALRIERQTSDHHAAEARAFKSGMDQADREAIAAQKRLTCQNHAVECAMRYVKVQSARFQRELLEAIDEIERCPK